MTYPKDILKFVEDIISNYATYDSISESYSLHLYDIPDDLRYEFAVKLMSIDESLACEATSSDNPMYPKMLTSIMRYMEKPHDKDEEIEFCKEWREGVAHYFEDRLQKLIDDACNNKLSSVMEDKGLYRRNHQDNNEMYWNRY